MTTSRSGRLVLAAATGLLAPAIATAVLLGPVGADRMVYRTSVTTLNQATGADLAALVVAVPVAVAAAALVWRGHRAGPPLAIGLGAYAVYAWTQVIVGQEYLRLPGNVERFFPLLLTIFVLGEVLVVLGWQQTEADLPPPSRRTERLTGWVLIGVACFLVIGLHLPTMLTAWDDPGSMTEYASAPTPFWLVKLMDLGIVVPAAVATGVGLVRRHDWARRITCPFLTAYAVLSTSVLSMAVVMLVNGDPDASIGLTAGFALFSGALVLLLVAWLRPLFIARPVAMSRLEEETWPHSLMTPD